MSIMCRRKAISTQEFTIIQFGFFKDPELSIWEKQYYITTRIYFLINVLLQLGMNKLFLYFWFSGRSYWDITNEHSEW